MSRRDPVQPSMVRDRPRPRGVVTDIAVVGSGLAALIVIRKCIERGYRIHHITRDRAFFPELDDRDEFAKDATSWIAPMRGWMGFHYLSNPDTIREVLQSSFELLRAFPILAKKMKRQRTCYHFLKTSTFDWKTALAGLIVLKETYQALYDAPESNVIRDFIPPPDQLYRIEEDLSKWVYLSDEARERILRTIVTTEGLLPIELIQPELSEVFNQGKEAGLYTVSTGKHVKGIITRDKKHYLMSANVDDGKQGLEVTESSIVNLLTWDRSSQLLKNCFVYRDDQVYRLAPPPLGIRVKQIVRFFVPKSRVKPIPDRIDDEDGKYVFDLDAPLDGLQSSFFGFSLKEGCMLAVDDSVLVKSPDGSGEAGYWCRATVSRLTNRLAVDDLAGNDEIRQLIDNCYADKVGADRVQADIIAVIEKTFKLQGCIKGVSSHLGTVLTGTFGLPPVSHLKSDSAHTTRKRRTSSRLSAMTTASMPFGGAAARGAPAAKVAKREDDGEVSDQSVMVHPGVRQCFDIEKNHARNPISSRRTLYLERMLPATDDKYGPFILGLCMKLLNAERLADAIFQGSLPYMEALLKKRAEALSQKRAEEVSHNPSAELEKMAKVMNRLYTTAKSMVSQLLQKDEEVEAEREKFDPLVYKPGSEPAPDACRPLTPSAASRLAEMRAVSGMETPAPGSGGTFFDFGTSRPSSAEPGRYTLFGGRPSRSAHSSPRPGASGRDFSQ